MKITIIIPVYNGEIYIRDCVSSFANKLIVESEVIIINDGSTDDSLRVCLELEKKYDNVTCYSQENKGLSETRNRGVELSSGDYILFLDCDDMLNPYELNRLIPFINKVDMLFFSGESFYEEIDLNNDIKKILYKRESIENSISGHEYFKSAIDNKEYSPSACMYFIKSSIAKKHKFIPNIYYEDIAYTTSILNRIDDLSVLTRGNVVYLRRLRKGSITTSEITEKNLKSYCSVVRCLSGEEKIKYSSQLKRYIGYYYREALRVNRSVNSNNLYRYLSWRFNLAKLLFKPKVLSVKNILANLIRV
ncbi:glycosyltransferase family 2 protein [Vibrio vulnificus]|uniref:glycosyltransferase family 2 protein n=1 Tax=Vibrio vulnificus TaxID=672 RepID=UPI0019D4271D|nr:glycosyltransferase [Vibrio vulnificus]MBN8133422.1 glycosyltransferase [Vibrio vulnificus]MBN8161151.1 glycosyltransferase [Vibrio vulnificus]